jgi:hypothetical protein
MEIKYFRMDCTSRAYMVTGQEKFQKFIVGLMTTVTITMKILYLKMFQ